MLKVVVQQRSSKYGTIQRTSTWKATSTKILWLRFGQLQEARFDVGNLNAVVSQVFHYGSGYEGSSRHCDRSQLSEHYDAKGWIKRSRQKGFIEP